MLSVGGRYAPTIDAAEWAATARLGQEFAAAVTLRAGAIELRP